MLYNEYYIYIGYLQYVKKKNEERITHEQFVTDNIIFANFNEHNVNQLTENDKRKKTVYK